MKYHDHIPDLPIRAFIRIGGRMTLEGGKGKAPKTPDYVGAANATAAGNADAARIGAKANRVDQYTPYGSITYYNPTQNGFNEAGYNAAMKTYQTEKEKYKNLPAGMISAMPSMKEPTKEQFMSGYDPDRWAMRIDLSPEQQQLLDAENKTSLGLAGLEDKGLSYVSNMLSTPFDQSKLPAQTINAGETAQDAILRRLQPQLDQQNEALRSRLANQGITLGSDAYSAEQRDQAMRENDLRIAAAIRGIDAGNQARQQSIQEQSFFRNEPLNTLNAVRSGAQVTNPTFSNVPQQQTTAGPDLLGAANSQYSGQLDAYNAQRAQSGALMGGLFSLGGAALGSPWLFK